MFYQQYSHLEKEVMQQVHNPLVKTSSLMPHDSKCVFRKQYHIYVTSQVNLSQQPIIIHINISLAKWMNDPIMVQIKTLKVVSFHLLQVLQPN